MRTPYCRASRVAFCSQTGPAAAKVPVSLMENSMNDPIKIFLQNKSGQRTPPVSSALTADDGTFALGVLQPGKSYDLRIVSDENPVFKIPPADQGARRRLV